MPDTTTNPPGSRRHQTWLQAALPALIVAFVTGAGGSFLTLTLDARSNTKDLTVLGDRIKGIDTALSAIKTTGDRAAADTELIRTVLAEGIRRQLEDLSRRTLQLEERDREAGRTISGLERDLAVLKAMNAPSPTNPNPGVRR